MPIQARQGSTVLMRIGNGPQFMAIGPAGTNPPSIAPVIGMTVENFNADRLAGILEQHGISKAAAGDPEPSGGPLKMRIRSRGATTELFFSDPDGLAIQLTDPKFCGGSGAAGDVCSSVEASPKKGLMALKDLNHFTINTSNGTRSN